MSVKSRGYIDGMGGRSRPVVLNFLLGLIPDERTSKLKWEIYTDAYTENCGTVSDQQNYSFSAYGGGGTSESPSATASERFSESISRPQALALAAYTESLYPAHAKSQQGRTRRKYANKLRATNKGKIPKTAVIAHFHAVNETLNRT